MSLLLSLLAISYVGSMLIRGRGLRGYGLPSGSEWLLLGIVIGPYGLRAVEPDDLHAFDPVAAVAVAWLALVGGASFGRDRPEGGVRAALAGIGLALASAALVAGAVFVMTRELGSLALADRLLLSAGIGLVSCETTHHAIAWVVQRHAARGPLSQFVSGMASCDDLLPLLSIAVPFALRPTPALVLPLWAWSIAPVLLGVLLGGTSAVLLNFEKHADRGWGVVLGAGLLTAGIAWRLGISPLTAMLALGASIALFSRHGAELRAMLGRTEHAVLLPCMVLAGASLHVLPSLLLCSCIAAACAVRIALRLLAAPIVARLACATSAPRLSLGLGLLPTGSITVVIGLTFALRFPEGVGPYVLCAAVVQTLVGEALGPAALRHALQGAGEIPLAVAEAAPASEPPAPANEQPDAEGNA